MIEKLRRVIMVCLVIVIICLLFMLNHYHKQSQINESKYNDEYYKRLRVEEDVIVVKEENASLRTAYKVVDDRSRELMKKLEEERNKPPDIVLVETIITNTVPISVGIEEVGENHYKIDENDMFISGDIYTGKELKLDYVLKPHEYTETIMRYDGEYWITTILDQTVINYANSLSKDDPERIHYYMDLSKIMDVKFNAYNVQPTHDADLFWLVVGGGLSGDSIFVDGGCMWKRNLIKISIDGNKKIGGSYNRMFSVENIFKKKEK